MVKGYWVKFAAPLDFYPGAHRSPDGSVIGILTPSGIDSLTGKLKPARINLVTRDTGLNLVVVVNNETANATVDPETTPFVRADVPGDCPIERVRHLVKGA